MRYEITEHGDEFKVRVNEIGDLTTRVLASIQQCQEGRCSCPTDLYQRLDAIDIEASGDDITVSLRPSAGERIDVNELQACLDYTVAQARSD